MKTSYPPLSSLTPRPTTAIIDISCIRHNIKQIRSRIGKRKIMAIVKADAYGHGMITVSRHLERFGVEQLGVAFLEEGVALRHAGITLPILVMGGILNTQIEHFIDFNLEITVSSLGKLEQVEKIAAFKKTTAAIHLKIDTGMERVGVHSDSSNEFITRAAKCRHIAIKGIYSHLACADDPDSQMTRIQLERLKKSLEILKELSIPKPVIHLANSGAILHSPDTFLDMVRPGIILYGIYPSQSCKKNILHLKPALSLKSKIVFFKVVKANRPISYGATWKTDHKTRVVTIPLGYGDGYRRALSNIGQVLIGKKKYQVVGKVCMDQFMVNIEWDSAYNGDEVILIGTQGTEKITVEQMAALADTIPYEILTGFNDRIPQTYINE
jgi:alanine racemase